MIGLVYVLFFGGFFFVAHVAFITHLRGNGVKLSADQMPELHERVTELAAKVGLQEVPDAYLVQAGGALNALATKFFRANFIVLFSDLLEACEDNDDARDFIIAHELGHFRSGHLRWRWLRLPGLLTPFLGTAYSRACEYTCDRYGFASSADQEQALDGLCILAAGGKHGPRINRRAFVEQRSDLSNTWMMIGQWLSTHPPLAHRLAALSPGLSAERPSNTGATTGALALLGAVIVVPAIATGVIVKLAGPAMEESGEQALAAADTASDPDAARAQAESGILSLAAAADAYRSENSLWPPDEEALYQTWSALHPAEAQPLDPYDGQHFGYAQEDGEYVIWSIGPDASDESDDLYYRSGATGGG